MAMARSSIHPRGDGGFGYDPYFQDTETGASRALELPLRAEKNELVRIAAPKRFAALIARLEQDG